MTPLLWSIAGGYSSDGTITRNTAGALYQAPSTHSQLPVTIYAASSLDPSRVGSATVNVINGTAIAATAATGTPSYPPAASANVGQVITISIPGPVFAMTGEGFSANQGVEFSLADAGNGCVTTRAVSTASVNAGMTTLTVAVPACAAPDQLVRVPGHGSGRLYVVPLIESIVADPNNFPRAFINGSGFVCGAGQTHVIMQTGPLPASEILQVTCTQIYISVLPTSGDAIQVTTAGGQSQVFTMP